MLADLDVADTVTSSAAGSNRSTHSDVIPHASSVVRVTESYADDHLDHQSSVDAFSEQRRRVPVTSPSSLHRHQHRLDVNEVIHLLSRPYIFCCILPW